MRWSVKIGNIAGTELKLHVTFLLFIIWIGVAHYLRGGYSAATQGVIFMLALFGCVLLHELGHVIAARFFHIRTPDITLLPIGGVARLERIPEEPWQELIVALAGPLVTLLIFMGLSGYSGAGVEIRDAEFLNDADQSILLKLAMVNWMILLFNLIPAFPMDGGRVFRALLATVTSYSRATRIAAQLGQGIAFLMAFAGLFINPFLVFIAIFIYLGAAQERVVTEMKDLTTGLKVADAMVTEFQSLDEEATLDDAVEVLLRTSQHEFPIVDDAGRPLGILTRDHMIAALKQKELQVPVKQIFQANVPVVEAEAPFSEALSILNGSSSRVVPVMRNGRIAGLLTSENIGEFVLVRSALEDGAFAKRHSG